MTGRLLCICVFLAGCATYNPYRLATVVLHNESLDLDIQPDIGRIVKICYQGRCDWLHFDPDSTENVGGEFLWPVAMHYWKPLLGRIWPPPVVMERNLWRIVAANEKSCTLIRDYTAPLNLRATRQYRLDEQAARFTIAQRIERLAPSSVPVTLWSILQVARPRSMLLPGTQRPLDGATGGIAAHGRDMHEIDFAGAGYQAHKLGSDAQPAWIAARRGQVLITQRVIRSTGTGDYPDGGCSVELWWDARAGYAELELLSPERNLAPGESLANEIETEFCQVNPPPVSPARTTRSPAP